ncbi:uncharacterized protein EI90DRAFT_262984 [Cantharellus anzutake]|uniref:uncharacterized protein n=1 Tax=Cantharellus anzutake TaxID=1750568 RepID=UPI00190900A9|nr:uncharacterized protein EI90DRAFT_262984 [Cantharellus anzutake]KAF8335831.1 hypothetical protein EI90DRAFT_262984 [Cantharellus anzutake]
MPFILEPCMICLCEVREPVALSCGHIFDHGCIQKYLASKMPPCPQCRRPISRTTRLFMRLSAIPYLSTPFIPRLLRFRDVNAFAEENLKLKERTWMLEKENERLRTAIGLREDTHESVAEEPEARPSIFARWLMDLGALALQRCPPRILGAATFVALLILRRHERPVITLIRFVQRWVPST